MPRLFKNIQGYFDATYSGRYVALLLAELCRHDSAQFRAVLARAGVRLGKGRLSATTEWQFPGTLQLRLADLAVLNEDGDPIVLIEVKDADGISKPNEAQISDYCRFLTSSPTCAFVLCSRHLPRAEDLVALKKARTRGFQLRFRHIYEALSPEPPLSRMLREYLEDIGVTYRHSVDVKAITYLTQKMLGLSGGKGLPASTAEAVVQSVPQVFDVMLGNLSVLGDWVHGANRNIFKQRFRSHFHVDPAYDLKKVVRFAATQPDTEASALNDFVTSGVVWFTAQAYLRAPAKKWLSLEIGYWSCIEPATRGTRQPWIGMYSQFDGTVGGPFGYNESETAIFPDEEQAQRVLRNSLRASLKAAKKAAAKEYAPCLDRFDVP